VPLRPNFTFAAAADWPEDFFCHDPTPFVVVLELFAAEMAGIFADEAFNLR
jgi:hypothetical protein